MNREIIEFLCSSHSSILNVPIRLYYERTLVQSYDPFARILNVDLTLPYINPLFDTEQSSNYIVTPELMLMGMLRDNNSPHVIIAGPVRIGELPASTARKIITSEGCQLRLDQIDELTTYLNHLPQFHVDQFTHILGMIYVSINHTLTSINDNINLRVEYEITAEVERNMLDQEEKTSFHGLQRRNPRDFEAEMLFCIKHGMTARLRALSGKADMKEAGILAHDTIRQYKNALIILNSLSIRAAIAGGLSPESCYQLGEIYIRKIEACTDLKQLGKLSHTIRTDYCERVRELHYPHSGDPFINKAIHYINENVHKKISAGEIAGMLSISPEYLSTRFKQITKTSIPDYINRQKILEAKRLLRLTGKPLSEISEYLSFSSQSYFQNVFRKLEGTTPLEYRNGQEDDIL